ncbi:MULTISPECIES: FtsW/RodA/SpoVE family cell cycle protein [Flavobacterium]|jgi:cell division protein FtsW|uniref:FtsW/RodA/SpoVE family cell cycle protein n=1 Tax=Flavobacterium TaxID=237 RepID=UPI0006F3BAC2|nr:MULTISPECIES: FtsW/RodA/SpoVE family cell cycle protein [Flavobacterium]MBU7571265.1 FtsW/RodA/SpoVE family cell cycle protein [Flavobacterium sp.]PZO29652.1 MAG: cell division protein FtsW [Flavobacteriaceae bacterium]KQS50315.1 cell division protein FtsW [Flavobacterium sp. Leaf359]MBL7867084.1 FtsW/RodA/SpoVE family cell cycle protein [Flavobacterium lindanitolerans]MDQ7959735.1 FtsW/RodA/SpoVE family cell cycle protein [Flavobacterium lindanitolerans]
MKEFINNLKGDKVIWAFIALLALISFMPVYSASSNLAYSANGSGNTMSFLIKHFAHVGIGFLIVYMVHKIPYHYFKAISMIALPIVGLLLLYTLLQGKTIGGANASRWIQIPFVGISFQTSTLASMVLMIYVARYLAKKREVEDTFKKSVIELWLPVFAIIMLILPANFSTAALIFSMVVMLVFVGKYPLKYLGLVIGAGIVGLTFFILMAKAFPDAFPNRVDTWVSRIENFTSDKPDEDNYQIEKAKIAIATGGIYGVGPGKSIQKNFLPQSSSDFIYAIIVEENGLLGALTVMFLYIMLFIRFLIASHKANTLFGKLLVVGLGFPIVFQALINMAVAVELLPVTGQTLPLISSGGSSIWMTCVSLGIILSVTKKDEEIAQENLERAQREEALQRLIEREMNGENNPDEDTAVENKEPQYAIEDVSDNPMKAVMGK